ncbi:ras association domain-containing protein 8 [Dunckerocampus dactyliophorus]|uniref:ras association domain-containing protein 8 n=1 Tax=Dunckerocampus dactyliophorus TaxID=161453 RepID=UPI00240628BE|nr:ras association domain-containing protein 8 [Dunckerocampus dactyliophorus]
MEVKVSVDGFPRLVCGVTDKTTCQDVVTVLAQALGQPGRYMLRESFKDFERCMAPDERPLETLKKYGEHAKEVQLTLLHSGPSFGDEMSRAKVGRHQPCPPLRRKEAGTKVWRRSGSLSLHRQSLPLSCLRRDTEQEHEDLKRPKRKSLTLMEEAWEWLESLGKTRVYSTSSDRDGGKKTDKKNRSFLSVTLSTENRQVRGHRNLKSDLDHQTSCCLGTQQTAKASKKTFSSSNNEDEVNHLREVIINQLGYIQDVQVQIAGLDSEILKLEQRAQVREDEQKLAKDENEQVRFWENELKAEEGFERDLQRQFLDMKVRVADCKVRLENKMHELDFCGALNVDSENKRSTDSPATENCHCLPFEKQLDVNINRKWTPRGNFNPPPPPPPPGQIKERRPTGPAELREWWSRWSATRSPKTNMKKTEIHRSELTIYLASTKV